MNYKISKLIFFLCFASSSLSIAQERTNEELAKIATKAFELRDKVRFQDELAVKTLRNGLAGLSDAEKIRAVFQILIEREKNSKLKMSSHVFNNYIYALGQDPDLIADYTELKNLLRNEEDPRKFYLLGCLTPLDTKYIKYDFIPEVYHMLFRDGRVLKNEGEYTADYSRDVSLFAYAKIVRILELHGQVFNPPKRLTHEQEVALLAKWLKANWKGCENMVIPEKFLKLSVPEVENLVKPIPQTPKTKPTPQAPQKKSPKKIKPQATQESAVKSTSKPEPEMPANEPKQTQKPKAKSGLRAWLIFASVITVGWLVSYMFKRKS